MVQGYGDQEFSAFSRNGVHIYMGAPRRGKYGIVRAVIKVRGGRAWGCLLARFFFAVKSVFMLSAGGVCGDGPTGRGRILKKSV